MPPSLFFANRYIKSKKESRFISVISLITSIGIALGVCVVIIALTVLDGFEKIVTQKITDMNSHIKITAFGNRNLPSPVSTIPKLESEFGEYFAEIEPFISKLSIIRSRRVTEGITILGITRQSYKSNLSKFIIAKNDSIDVSESIIIGKKLSEKLLIGIGDKVTVFSLRKDEIPSLDNPPSIQQFTVNSIFESGMSEYDDLNAYIDYNTAQNLFEMNNEISGYNLKLNDITKIDSLSESLQDFLGYPYYVRSIYKVYQNIFTWIDLQKEPIPIILGLIIFVAVFNIIGTLLMIVLEKTNAIGVIRSLGGNRKLITKIFLLNGIYLTVLGILSGNIIAYLLSVLQDKFDIISLPDKIYFVTRVPIFIDINNYILVSVITAIISISASLLPAYAASKIKPLSAIKFD